MLHLVMAHRCHSWVGETTQILETTVNYFLWWPLPLLFGKKKDYAVNAAFVRDQADLCHAEVVCDQETP